MSRLGFVIPSVLVALSFPLPASANRLGGGTPIDRGGNTMNLWCPNVIYQTVPFTADGPEATLIFTAQTHSSIQFPICEAFMDSTTCWLAQGLDNVMVVPTSVYSANLDAKGVCIVPDSVDVFLFDLVDPSEFLLMETFNAGIDPGWELNRVYEDSTRSATTDLSPSYLGGFSEPGTSLQFGLTDDVVDCSNVPPTEDCSSFATASIQVTGLQAGTEYMLIYWWTSAVDYSCCTSPWEALNGDLFVDIYGADAICSIVGPDPVCQGGYNTYAASLSPPGGTVSYSWSILGDGHIVGPTTGSSVDVQAENPGSYTLSLDVVQDGSPGACMQLVTVNPVPDLEITGPSTMCNGATETFLASVNPGGGMVVYSWSVTGNGTLVGGGGPADAYADVQASAAGGFSITLEATRNGCSSAAPVALPVSVLPNPTCNITGPSTVCESSMNIYNGQVSPGGGTVTYAWSVSGNGSIVGSTSGASVTVQAGAAGSFTLTLDTNRDGCPGVCQFVIPVIGGPLHVPSEYSTIQTAINAAACGGDTILVAAGIYSGPGNQNINFLGKDVVVLAESGPEQTIIECGGTGSGVLFQSGEGSGSVLEGFTIQNAGNSALRILNSSPTVRGCRLLNSLASFGGGAYLSVSSAQFFYCEFRGNSATTYGGGVYVTGTSTPLLWQCALTGNWASLLGGGLYTGNATDPVLVGCTVAANYAGSSGGGMRVFGTGTTAVADSSIVWGNCSGGTFDEVAAATGTTAQFHCSVLDTSGIGGGGVFSLSGSYIEEDPLFCDPSTCGEAPTTAGDFSVHAASVAAFGNNACGATLGSQGVGCTYEIASIADVGNDQGRQVRLTWYRAPDDQAGATSPVTGYSLWRRVEAGLLGGTVPEQGREEVAGLAFPPGDWDFVQLVPAYAEAKYSAVVPTLCDSTAGGICWSTFFVRTQTGTPSIFADTVPDSGYSVDNLSPGAPGMLLLSSGALLSWEESGDTDFDHFSVYGSNTGTTQGANLLGQTTETTLNVSGSVYSFYFVTASDFSGNEGPSTRQISIGPVPGGSLVAVPLGPDVVLTFDAVAASGEATLAPTPEGASAPAGLLIVPSGFPVYYDLSTTAAFTGDVEVAVAYRPAELTGPEEGLRLYLFDETVGGGAWRDITLEVDLPGHRVRGRATSLSAFAVMEGGSPTAIREPVLMPSRLRLHPGLPNPFRSSTRLTFELPEPGPVRFQVIDAGGRLVRTLAEGRALPAGIHELTWDGRDATGRPAAAGVYFYRLEAPSSTLVQKGILLR